MKQTRITISQDGLLILRSRIVRRAWCPACGAESEMVTGVAQDRWLDSLPLHRSQAAYGTPLICMRSLLGVANTKIDSPRQAVEPKKKELP